MLSPRLLNRQPNQAVEDKYGEHILFQFSDRYFDLHRTTPRERYELLMRRCPGIVEHLSLQDIASFLNVTPTYLSKIRKEITFGKEK